ncbi:MAG: hypothetical protein OEW23_12905 [Candidatus Aminicenantes bacterium]|nr:hypothetical protein [Candidatus Aminicenantes bacterium]
MSDKKGINFSGALTPFAPSLWVLGQFEVITEACLHRPQAIIISSGIISSGWEKLESSKAFTLDASGAGLLTLPPSNNRLLIYHIIRLREALGTKALPTSSFFLTQRALQLNETVKGRRLSTAEASSAIITVWQW